MSHFWGELKEKSTSESAVTFATDRRFNVSDDNINSLNGHLVELEIVWRESIVWNDDVGVLLGWLNVALKGWLGLILVGLEERGEWNLVICFSLGILEDTARQTYIVICVNEK